LVVGVNLVKNCGDAFNGEDLLPPAFPETPTHKPSLDKILNRLLAQEKAEVATKCKDLPIIYRRERRDLNEP